MPIPHPCMAAFGGKLAEGGHGHERLSGQPTGPLMEGNRKPRATRLEGRV